MREFLTEAVIAPPPETTKAEIDSRIEQEGVRASELARQGSLLRAWRPDGDGWRNIVLWQAEDEAALQELLASLPLHEWMSVNVRPLLEHPSDPARSDING